MYKVLIVDDETPALRYLQTIVEKYAPSYEIAGCCTSGEEALARLQKEQEEQERLEKEKQDKYGWCSDLFRPL